MGKLNTLNERVTLFLWPLFAALICCQLLMLPAFSYASDNSQCAVVKIEITQELTLERQAFEAHMRISNGLSHITLENVDIDVVFADEEGNNVLASSDPDNTAALFFIRVDAKENIDDVDGAGTVSPSSSADIYWLIIPAPGSSNGRESGALYYVGATLTYTIGGEEQVTEVTPDYIFVKPMPELTLDYFLPTEVYGDDAFTSEIESPVPFSLGVRVKNSGFGVAHRLKIDSSQPKIVENEQGLLISFVIEGCEVNGQVAAESLLADFGDLEPNASAVARWQMSCSLSGSFIEFTADFSHADELGGELTSLLSAANSHFLIHDVLVDLTGRDAIRDFLAKDNDVYRIYESDSVDTEVLNQSAAAEIQFAGEYGSESHHILSVPATPGFMYVQFPDPYNGQNGIKGVTRSDGKYIKAENAWLSKTRDEEHNWQYFVNLFDVKTTDSYTLIFADVAVTSQPPVLQFIQDCSKSEGEQLSFIIAASDPNGTTPGFSAAPLPAGAGFVDQGNGTAIFTWTPAVGQAGSYEIIFGASDGTLEDTQRVILTIYSSGDGDGDGMPDGWEMQHFGTLDRNGTGDFDGDGIVDLNEYLYGTDPLANDNAPGVPLIQSPVAGVEVNILSPELVIENSIDPDGDPLTYEFELYADSAMTSLVSGVQVAETVDTTSWIVPVELEDNSWYRWRVRATDGTACSLWAYGSFFVNTENDFPGNFRISSPKNDVEVDTVTPILEVTNAGDSDEDQLTYTFEVYADSGMGTMVVSATGISLGVNGVTAWNVHADPPLVDLNRYYWRALAVDAHGAQTESALVSFLINCANPAPDTPVIVSPADVSEITLSEVELLVNNVVAGDGDSLTYFFELDRVKTFDSEARQTSGAISAGVDTTAWQVTGLDDNTPYYWRVKCSDGAAESGWQTGSFLVNTANEPPSIPTIKNPGQNAWVTNLTPILAVHPFKDPDFDSLNYDFEVCTDASFTNLVTEGESSEPEWLMSQELENNTRYYWRARAVDEHGLAGDWSAVTPFLIRLDGTIEPSEIEIRVKTDKGRELAGLKVYAFTSSGSYAGKYAVTGEDGIALFEPEELSIGSYKFRVDYLGQNFWSEVVAIPGASAVDLVIGEETAVVAVMTATGPVAAGTKVYLFSETGSYLGISQVTDANGAVSFALPRAKNFKFRADILSYQYWSDVIQVNGGAANNFTIDSGGGSLRVTVQEDSQNPISGINTYLFNPSGTYLRQSQETDSYGVVEFDMSAGTYKIRADYLGYQFWSPETQLNEDTSIELSIAHQDVEITVNSMFQDTSASLEGLTVYLFNPTGTYLRQYQVTDANSQVFFYLPERGYKVRADFLGQQYWSEEFIWQDALINVPMAEAEVVVNWNEYPLEGVMVYLFSAADSYLRISGLTDVDGRAVFRLPVGTYKFRADYQGSQYWSVETELVADQVNPITISTGGGPFSFTVLKTGSEPLMGAKCYVFNEAGSYLNIFGTTNNSGQVFFDLANGSYKFRVDYLGYQFWTELVSVPETLELAMNLDHQDLAIRVQGVLAGDSRPLVDIPVYLFTPSGSYLSLNSRTDGNGEVVFNLPPMPYKVRADTLGWQFWSEEFNQQDYTLTVAEGIASVRVSSAGQEVSGVPVYLFSSSESYLSVKKTTSVDGLAEFRLPAGVYKFRADYQGNQYWANAVLDEDLVNNVEIDTGGGEFVLTVDTGAGPLTDTRIYVFNSRGTYLGIYGNTDSNGRVFFSLPDGSYKFRADHLGNQFWTEVYELPGTLSGVFTIPHQEVSITVEGRYLEAEAMEGLKVYLFTPSGSYLSQYQVSDENGRVSFILPDREYKVRVDYLGRQFWSDVFQFQDTTVTINRGHAHIHVHRSGSDQVGVRIYLFSEGGSYLGWYENTDAVGMAEFLLPASPFKFRVDEGGNQYWSPVIEIIAGEENMVEMDLD